MWSAAVRCGPAISKLRRRGYYYYSIAFVEYFLCTRQCSKLFAHAMSFNPYNSPLRLVPLNAHVTDEEVEAEHFSNLLKASFHALNLTLTFI